MLFLPVYSAQFYCEGSGIVQTLKIIGTNTEYSLGYARGVGQLNSLPVIFGTLNIAILVLAVVDLALFSKRDRQLFLSRLLLLLSIIYIALLYYTVWYGTRDSFCTVNGRIENGAFLPLLSPVILLLAIIAILKDIQIVKSADRFR
jgi:hypothetical protein